MNLCHLHNVTTISEHAQKILNAFEESKSLVVNSIDTIDDYDAYVVELQNLDKDTSLRINKIFERKKNSLIYFIVSKDYNLILFQLAILLEVKYLITQNQDTDMVIKKIKSDIKLNKKSVEGIPIPIPITDTNAISTNTESSISNRLIFVETLKNKLVNNISKDSKLSVITIGIEDEKRLQKNLSRSDVENFLYGLLSYMDLVMEKKLIFSQYDRDYYIALFEHIEFDDVKKIAHDFYAKSVEYISKKEFQLLIDIFVFNLEGFEFNVILDTLEDIEHKEIDKEKTEDFIERIGTSNVNISEYDVLVDAFKDKLEFSLFNIYNGLGIHTSSQIIKLVDNSVYIRFEQLQGVIMNIENNTIMQSSAFLKDIQANVRYIDMKKKIAILDSFKFLDTNANSRKYSRVTPSARMPVTIYIEGGSLNGDIIDLSIKSIISK